MESGGISGRAFVSNRLTQGRPQPVSELTISFLKEDIAW